MWIKTLKQAKRLIKIVVGFTLLLLGMIMWLTPGPGWAAVIAGLAILAAEFVWARRLLNKIKEKGVAVSDAVLSRESWLRRLVQRFGGRKETPAGRRAAAPAATVSPAAAPASAAAPPAARAEAVLRTDSAEPRK